MTTLTLQPVARRRAPWYLVAPALACALAMFVPVAYLILRASQADAEMLRDVVFRGRTLALLGNTVGLSAAVLVVVTILGLPMAWLTTRCALRGRSMLTLLAVLPLAVPGYLMAYTLLSIGGDYGTVSERLGVTIPRLSGFPAALIALSLYNLPYMFLNLRVAMQRMDPALEEAARSLGLSPRRVFLRVVLPQLRPALWAGGLLVTLHVIGDFGVVSLTRFETFSYALYQHVESNDKAGAAWLGLMLIVLTAGLLVFELRFLRGLRLDPAGAATSRIRRPLTLGRWAPAAYIFLLGIAAAGVAVPLATISFWCVRAAERGAAFGQAWLGAVADSMSVSVPAAVLTTALALPLAYLARRYPSPMSRGLEQSAYIGYATPSLAFALGLVFFTLLLPRTLDAWHERLVDWPVIARVVGAASNAIAGLYQTLGLLIIAYSLHFLAEAIGPVRTALFVATPRLEEASRSLGHGRIATFARVTFPLLRPGIVVSASLVFLSVMKELPITYILSPLNFQPLSLKVWGHVNEAQFIDAAPYALTILLLSAAFVGLLLMRGHEDAT